MGDTCYGHEKPTDPGEYVCDPAIQNWKKINGEREGGKLVDDEPKEEES